MSGHSTRAHFGCGVDHREGDWRPLTYCNPLTWITENIISVGVAEAYIGEGESVHDGPIEFVWDGDDWGWRYVDA